MAPNTAGPGGLDTSDPDFYSKLAQASAAWAAASSAALGNANSTDPFRFDSTRLRAFKASLANAAGAPVEILTLGDSIAEGQGGTAIAKRWIEVLRDRLRARYQPAGVVGGEGYVPAYYGLQGYSARVTYTGTLTNPGGYNTFGLGRRAANMSAGATATMTFAGTGLDIIYAKGGSAGTFSWAIDGGTATNVNANNASVVGGQVAQIRGLSAGSHTVVVTAASGAAFLEGFMVYNGDESSGIHVRDGAHYGYRTADFLDETNRWTYDAWTPAQPSLVLWELTGVNDYGTSTTANRLTPAQTVANISTLLARLRAKCTLPPSVVMFLNYERVAPTGTPLDTWANYLQAVSDFAKADGGITLVDVSTLMGTAFSVTDPYGLSNADKVHPSDKGHATIAEQVYRVLTAA